MAIKMKATIRQDTPDPFFSQNLGQIDVHKSQRPKKGALTVVVVPKTGVACEMMIDQSVLTDYF